MASPGVNPTQYPNQNLENEELLKIMVLGKTGSGKSTLINSVVGEEVASTRSGTRQQKHPTLKEHSTEINGVHLTFYDTRGIGYSPEETRKVLDDIRGNLSSLDPDLFLICIKLAERLTQETLDAIRDIKEMYGNFFLQRCIVVCTFTNMLDDNAKRHKPNISRQEMAREIEEEVRFVSSQIQDTWRDVPVEKYSEIPFICVGWRNTNDSSREEEELKLSTSDNWIHDFFVVCSRRCHEKNLKPLTKVAVKCVPWKRKVAYAAVIGGASVFLACAIGKIYFSGPGFVDSFTLGAKFASHAAANGIPHIGSVGSGSVGTGIAGIVGSGSVGTGIAGIVGSGSVGTGIAGIVGTGSVGAGIAGIVGSGSVGTGIAGIVGSGSVGTGIARIVDSGSVGTGIAGIVGTGSVGAGIAGIVGSGSVGTGMAGIVGTGFAGIKYFTNIFERSKEESVSATMTRLQRNKTTLHNTYVAT